VRSALVMSHLRSSRKQRQRPLAEVPEGPCPSSREVHETIARDVRHRAAAMAGSMVSDFFFYAIVPSSRRRRRLPGKLRPAAAGVDGGWFHRPFSTRIIIL
jgi:hypothetical protein